MKKCLLEAIEPQGAALKRKGSKKVQAVQRRR